MISVIIPAKNEEQHLRATLSYLREHAPPGSIEIIVAEGYSVDRTAEVARPWAKVIHAHLSTRACLMNAGAEVAKGDVLLFLHADSLPPPNFVPLIQAHITADRVVGGAFDHQFIEPVLGLKLVSTVDRIRFRLTRNFYGDQGIFVRKDAFERLGGFPARAILEDLEFSRRLRRAGRTVIIPKAVRTSGRRFLDGGICRTFIWMVGLLLLHTLRLDTERYAAVYREANGVSSSTPVVGIKAAPQK